MRICEFIDIYLFRLNNSPQSNCSCSFSAGRVLNKVIKKTLIEHLGPIFNLDHSEYLLEFWASEL